MFLTQLGSKSPPQFHLSKTPACFLISLCRFLYAAVLLKLLCQDIALEAKLLASGPYLELVLSRMCPSSAYKRIPIRLSLCFFTICAAQTH